MRTESEFQTYFESVLKVLLQPLEDYRVKRIKIFKQIQYVAIFLGVGLLLNLFFGNPPYCFLILFLILVVEGYSFEYLTQTNNTLRRAYKSRIIPKMLEFLNSQFEYVPNQKISKFIFEKSFLFPHEIDVVQGEDFMKFKIGEVDIMFCESKVYGYPPISKMFEGIFISATFNKTFSSKTFIFPVKSTSFFRKLKFKTLGSSFQVKLEDPDFEKAFIVLSEDQVESRYLLTTSLMQRLLDYKRKLNAELAFSLIGNRLYCSIPSCKNLFEPALFDSFLDINYILQSYEPLMLYTGLVEDLHLNVKIWSKQ